MGHGHGHGQSAAGQHRRPLVAAFAITAIFMVVELVVGIATGSLALISDAAHMGTDVLGLGMALAAVTVAARVTTSQRTYGLYRLEVLAAVANGVLLFAVAGYVLYEAWRRWQDPPAVPGAPLLVVAVLGLLANLVSYRLLSAGAQDSLNLKGASLEVLGDLLGSLGVILAAVVLWTTGWRYADPLVGAAIGLFILPRTYLLLRQAVRILMEAAPEGIDVAEMEREIRALPGVVDVHDLHVWTVTSGMETATGHVVIDGPEDLHPVLDRVRDLLASRYRVQHATIQCEPRDHDEEDLPI